VILARGTTLHDEATIRREGEDRDGAVKQPASMGLELVTEAEGPILVVDQDHVDGVTGRGHVDPVE
jgi:hypothetical protein